MSTTILSRIDDLGSRLDELERAVGDLAVAVRATAARVLAGHADALRVAPQADVNAASEPQQPR